MDRLTPAVGGGREEPDEMLLALAGLPGRDEPPVWAGDAIWSYAEMLTERGVFCDLKL